MAPEPSGNTHGAGLARDRPWILACNRKLRSLNGISFRNLSLLRSNGRARGKTIDDESLPTTLQTTAKLLSKRESQKLGHSRSSDELRPAIAPEKNMKQENVETKSLASVRPLKDRLRRRSTLNWTNSAPQMRQQRLQDATVEHMADLWFSIHCKGIEDPIYISEVVQKAMNPSFKAFDLDMYGPQVTRQDAFAIKIWARAKFTEGFILLVDLWVNLRSLQYLESFHHPLPSNCVLFHLSDGIYTSFTDLPLQEIGALEPKNTKQSQNVLSSSSFEALMRLSNLDDCIQDALATREKLATQISSLLEEQKSSRGIIDEAAQAVEKLASTNRSLSSCRKHLRNAQARRDELKVSLETRRAAIVEGRSMQEEARGQVMSSAASLAAASTRVREMKAAVSGQIRRICEDLLAIYPIESVDPKTLSYTVRDIPLPNANSVVPHMDADPVCTAAALGLVAHIVQLLSLYLSTPIPYPPTPHGSSSTIYDPISASMPSAGARTFPLFQNGAVAYRFDYGVFLLNSDIELLMSRQGAKVVDLRHTLPNLKYILTVLTAGKGELPVRKKGGIWALQNGQAPVMRKKDDDSGEKHRYANGKASPKEVV